MHTFSPLLLLRCSLDHTARIFTISYMTTVWLSWVVISRAVRDGLKLRCLDHLVPQSSKIKLITLSNGLHKQNNI